MATGHKAQALYGIRAAHAQAHHADAHIGNGLCGKLNHILLTRRPGRHLSLDNARLLAA